MPSSLSSPPFLQRGTGAITQTVNQKLLTLAVSPQDYGAVADGSSHPLSDYYATLAAAQVSYPFATALSNEIDGCAVQAALDYLTSVDGGTCWVPHGEYLCSTTIYRRHPAVVMQGAGEGSETADGIPCILRCLDRNANVMEFLAGDGQPSNHYLNTRNITLSGLFTTSNPVSISTAAGSGTTLTVTTPANHGLATNDIVCFRGLDGTTASLPFPGAPLTGGEFIVTGITTAKIFTCVQNVTAPATLGGSSSTGEMIQLFGTGDGLVFIGETSDNFYDQVGVFGCIVKGVRRAVHASRLSNSLFQQLTIQDCFDGFYLENSINAVLVENCSVAACVNVGYKILGGTGLTLIGCEGGNQPKQIYAENCNIGINKLGIENCSGDPWDGTKANCAIECGTNGAIIASRLVILAGDGKDVIPIMATAAGSKVVLSDSGMSSFNHTDMMWLARNNMFLSRKIRSDGLVRFFDDYTLTSPPLATLGSLDCEAYFEGDEPAASMARSGTEFMTLGTYDYLCRVLKTNATYTNWPVAGGPPPAANGTTTPVTSITNISGRIVAIS